jgi:DnaJ-class molecular chaperone
MAALQESYYDILQIQKAASDADIKKAYRKLAMKWHPDKNPEKAEEAAKRFQEIGEAYDVLSDPEKRAIYDQFGYDGLKNGIPGQEEGMGSGYNYKENAQEIFENFFGTGNPFSTFGFGETAPFSSKLNKPGPKKEDPVFYNLDCTLSELYNGCIKKFNVTRKRFTPEGDSIEEAKVLTIGVKPGWKKGTKITFPCEGDEVVGGISADIIFVIQEKPDDSSYVRDGHNLIYTYKLNLADALTDCSLQIPTLDQRVVSIACPEVVSPFYEKIVSGEGMPISKKPGTRGDLIIKFHILFPKYLNGAKKIKLRELLGNEETLN